MGMLLRTVDEDEFQPFGACLSDEEFDKLINILGKESPSAKRLKKRLRSKGETERDIYAWGIKDEEVYKQVMDGDPMVVAVNSDDDPSDYEIRYVTELEFCLHKDVYDDRGEELSEAIWPEDDEKDNIKYVMFSTIPPVDTSDESDETRTLEYVEERLDSNENELNTDNDVPGDRYIQDTELSQVDNKGEPLVSEELINDILNLPSERIPTEVLVWAIGTGSTEDDEEQGVLWRGSHVEFEDDSFYKNDVAYMGNSDEEAFRNQAEVGDIIIARKGIEEILGVGVIQTEYYRRCETEVAANRKLVRTVDWLINKKVEIEEYEAEVPFHQDTFKECGVGPEENWDKYCYIKNEFSEDADYFDRLNKKSKHKKALHQKLEEYRRKHNKMKKYTELLEDEKQVLFYGPPGTGKTHMAQEIAKKYHEDRTKFVTFHPSYSYEEFVQGIRPVTDSEDDDGDNDDGDSKDDDGDSDDGELSYKLEDGVFKNLCEKAQENQNEKYLLVIDEVNRGNISSIFGELITLLEEDKRGDPENDGEEATKVSLPYSDDEDLWVPDNLHIIGTMNTADRSIAKLDVALRRRFAHVPFEPDIEELAVEEFEEFEEFEDDDDSGDEKAIEFLRKEAGLGEDDDREPDPVALSALAIREINERLMDDEFDVEAGKKIGHSYMMDMKDEEDVERAVKRAWKYEILPLLNEYFFDQYDEIAELLDDEDEVIVDTDMKRFEELEDLDWDSDPDSDSDDDLKSVLNGLADEQGD